MKFSSDVPVLDDKTLFSDKTDIDEITSSLASQGLYLNDVIEKLRSLDKIKDEFFRICSNNLKSTIQIIESSSADFLSVAGKEVSEAQKLEISRIQRQTKYAFELIEELLGFSKMNFGLNINYALFSFNDLVNKALLLNSSTIDRKKVTVSLTSQVKEFWVRADSQRMLQVVNHLLINAVESASSTVEINLSILIGKRRADLGKYMLKLEIWDDGTTLSPDNLDKLFNKYKHVSTDDKNMRLGAGLAICKHICQSHHGNIWAKRKNRGTSFFTILPFVQIHPQDNATKWVPLNEKGQIYRILYISKKKNTDLHNKLKEVGLHVQHYSNANDFLTDRNAKQVDLIIIDLHFEAESSQGINDFELIKSTESLKPIPRCIAINPTFFNEQSKMHRNVHGILTKPCSKNEILFKLRNIFELMANLKTD